MNKRLEINLGSKIELSLEELKEFQEIAEDEWNVIILSTQLRNQATRAVLLGKLLLNFDNKNILVDFQDLKENNK